MKLRELFSEIKLRSKGAEKDLKSFDKGLDGTKVSLDVTEKKSKTLGSTLKVLAKNAGKAGASIAKGLLIGTTAIAAVTAGVTLFVKGWAEATDEIGKEAGKLGDSADAISSLGFAAQLSGSSMEKMVDGLKDLKIKTREAIENPTSDAAKVFQTLGINVKKFTKLRAVDRIGELRKAFRGVSDDATNLSFRIRLMGEAGKDLGVLLNSTSEEFKVLGNEAQDLGGILTDDMLKAAADLNDEWDRAIVLTKGLRGEIASRLAPVITRILKKWRDLTQAQRDAVVQRLIVFFEKLIRIAEDFLPKLFAMAEAIAKFTVDIGGLDTALKVMIGTFAAFKIAAAAALGPAAPWIAGIAAAITLMTILNGKTRANMALMRRQREEQERTGAQTGFESEVVVTDEELGNTELGQSILTARNVRDDAIRRAREFEKAAGRFDAAGDNAGALVSLRLASRERDKVALGAETVAVRERAFLSDKRRQTNEANRAKQAKADAKSAKLEKFRPELINLQGLKKRTRAQRKRLKFLAGEFGVDVIPLAARTSTKAKEKKPEEVKKPLTINELIAQAVGQGTALGGGALRPAGLGTTINHIDASIKVAAPIVTITVESSPNTDAKEVASRVKKDMPSEFIQQLERAFELQIRQVQG